MASNKFVIREEEMDDLSAGMNKIGNNTQSASKGVIRKFAGTTSSGMGPSVKAVSKELNLISNSIGNIKNIMKKYSKEIFDYDFKMAKVASDIEIPLDFLANNDTKVNTYNKVLLGKIDGRSVNEGKTSHEFEEIADNSVKKEDLLDITGAAAHLEQYDANSKVTRAAMDNIRSDKDQVEQALDDRTVIGHSALGNINNGNVQRAQELDESTVIGKSVLGKINKDIVPGGVEYEESDKLDDLKADMEEMIPMHEENSSVNGPTNN